MIVEIHITLRDDNARDGLGEWIASAAILNTDSTDRAIATFMDLNAEVAKVIESGTAYIQAEEVTPSLKETKRPLHWSKQPALDPAWDEAIEARYEINDH